nr:DUF6600 domain-containing protein [Rhizobium sp. EC-SD404]
MPSGLDRDWRPYTQGHWAYTNDYGWYWVSDEPFGWATYHYGRWGYSRSYGWYWVPGNVWAPAWVTWRTGGDYVGWAPLAPEGSGYAWGAPSSFRPPVAESWIFVETRYISSPTIVQHVEPIAQIPVILTQATTRVDVRIEQNIIINQPIEISQIENVVVEPVQTINLTFVDDPDQATASDGQVVAFQADISEEEPQETPANVAESAEQIEEPAIIEETLEDVPAEADAPSAAEVEEDTGDPAADEAGTEEAPADEAPAVPDAEAPATGQEPAAEGTTEDTPADDAGAEDPASDTAPEGEPAAETPAATMKSDGAEQPVGAEEQTVEDEAPPAEVVPAEPEEAAPVEREPAVEEAAPSESGPAEEAAPTEAAPENGTTPAEGEAATEPEALSEESPAEQLPAEEGSMEDEGSAPAEQPADAETCPEGRETC